MIRMNLLLLVAGLLVVCGWSSVHAQVAIGGDGTVTAGAVLDLSQTGVADGDKGGLLLPSVASLPTENLVPGMQFFLTSDNTVYTYTGDETWSAGGATANALIYKGTASTYSQLTDSVQNPVIGDVWDIHDTGANYAWDGANWDKLGETIDLSAYALTTDVNAAIALKASIESPTFTGTVKVPSKATAATADGTLVATEAQVRSVADAVTLLALPDIITQPAKFTFKRSHDAIGDPNAPVANATALTVAVTPSAGVTYQWYSVPFNQNAAPVSLGTANGANTATYTVPAPADGVANWGLTRVYCVVTNAAGSVKSGIAEVAIGCGAKASDGGWLRFMCQNVGAAPVPAGSDAASLVAYGKAFDTPVTDTGSEDARGGLFQWGRSAGGNRTLKTMAAPVPNPSAQASDTAFYTAGAATQYDWYSAKRQVVITAGDTIKALDQNDFLWQPWASASAVCGGGTWYVPSQQQWANIYRTDGSVFDGGRQTPNAIANSWSWDTKGYKIMPDGTTTTLFLPAAGYRIYSNGALARVGTYGYYWSATVYGRNAHYLYFTSTGVYPVYTDYRANGFSVRCVAQ
ncbi:MAG: fibrobacter succinogenes major paralogous domain-containing protein [Candidatus Symbiothrix sp.]|nr:fibrobacter succinogenes major paralogous domain-containing protein [Candidatus Symbiothrix sp.]